MGDLLFRLQDAGHDVSDMRVGGLIEEAVAEIQALRVDVEAWKASHSLLTDTCHHFQARAKLLSAECVELAVRWERMGDEHGVRQFTGNDHKLFANELRAVLHKWSQRE